MRAGVWKSLPINGIADNQSADYQIFSVSSYLFISIAATSSSKSVSDIGTEIIKVTKSLDYA